MSRIRSFALPLSRHAVDRDHEARSRPALFDELWDEPTTRILPLWKGRALLTAGERRRRDAGGRRLGRIRSRALPLSICCRWIV